MKAEKKLIWAKKKVAAKRTVAEIAQAKASDASKYLFGVQREDDLEEWTVRARAMHAANAGVETAIKKLDEASAKLSAARTAARKDRAKRRAEKKAA